MPGIKCDLHKNISSLGIVYDVSDLDNIMELNIEPKPLEIEELIRIWQTRNLTSIGKMNLIKKVYSFQN